MKNVHFIGIGGTGLSAIARVLLESGYAVTGSDLKLSPLALDIQAAGAEVFEGHHANNVRNPEIVIRSSAIPEDNPEIVAAKAKGIPVLKRADFLGQLLENRVGIAVAGSHGKTTTTAMLAWVLTALGRDPSFIVGGVVTNLGVNASAGLGDAFVIEEDEYDYMFLGLKPKIAVITNVEHDHPDIFPTQEIFRKAFQDFVGNLPPQGALLVCGDDPGVIDTITDLSLDEIILRKYGISSNAFDYYASSLMANDVGGASFDFYAHGQLMSHVSLQLPGEHNVQNALAVMAVIEWMELSVVEASQALGEFTGTGRRFQLSGEVAGVTVIDDYAHHPTEIRATLAAARSRYSEHRIWAIWQPHTYSRTKLFFNEFAIAFNDADRVLVTEVYRSREPLDADFSSSQLVDAMQHQQAKYTGSLENTVDTFLAEVQQGDIVLVLSAGDATWISERVMEELTKVEIKTE